MNVLSLFDGMACGMLAMKSAGITVDRYVAFEYDEKSASAEKGRPYGFAALTASHNFPMIEQRGNVFRADFTEFSGFDVVLAGFPCTKFSIAQKNDRETEPYSGEGWLLFEQAWRAVCEAKPQYFIFENNKSMAKAVQREISKIVGFKPICINSNLVSAQNRQRLYWVGKRNIDGTYSRVKVEQPEDRGILLRDILTPSIALREKGNCLCGNRGGTSLVNDLKQSRHNYATEPVAINTTSDGEKARTLAGEPVRIPEYGNGDKARPLGANYPNNCGGFEHRMFSDNPSKQQVDMVVQPVGIGYRGRMEDGKWVKRYESNEEPKANALTTAQTDSMIAEPVRVGTYPNDSKNKAHDSQQYRIYSTDGKAVTQCGNGGGMGAKTGLYAFEVPVYAQPIEWDENRKPTKAVSGSDGKTYPVYEVKDGQITIKGKQYPIKLADGFYIIRKLTVSECKMLQTVPEWYEFPVSDTQAYKMLGNGWTVEVIAHLIKATQADEFEEEQLDLFKMIGCYT